MIELVGAAIAVADLIDQQHASGPDPDFDEVVRSFRPRASAASDLENMRVSVVPFRSVSEASSRGSVDYTVEVRIGFQVRLAGEQDPEDDFDAVTAALQLVAAVENTLWANPKLSCTDPAVSLTLTGVEEAPTSEEAVSAVGLDEQRVVTAVISATYLARRFINAS